MREIPHTGHVARFGYQPNPEHSDALHERMQPRFGGSFAALAAADDGGDRYLYRPLVAVLAAAGLRQWLQVDGGYVRLKPYDQGNTNTCHGNQRALQTAIEHAVAMTVSGAAEALPAMPAAEVSATFAQQIDGTLGSDYGASISAEVEGSEKYGTGWQLPVGSYDLSQNNWDGGDVAGYEARVRQFVRKGVPAEIAAFAQQHRSQSHQRIEAPDACWTALGHYLAVMIGSNISYEADRNEEGIIRATGADWPHALLAIGRRTSAKYGRLYLIANCWKHTWTGGPYWLDQPLGSFWIVEADLAKMLACRWDRRRTIRDSWISTGNLGFPARSVLPTWLDFDYNVAQPLTVMRGLDCGRFVRLENCSAGPCVPR